MNDKKIAFIICTNNELYYDECVWYITQLNVPEDYETDIIAIRDAESMTAAYNAAMESSDAKYKVYLHQDVFIYHKDFIKDVLKTFQNDTQIGMLGVLGGVNLSQDAILWNAWNRGATYSCNHQCVLQIECQQSEFGDYTEVEAIDGMLMVTQYDIPWREDLKLGWDFYDVSQSLEFRRRGYKIAIPYQQSPWCLHDCGYSQLNNYDAAREKILNEYRDFFTAEFSVTYDVSLLNMQEQLFQQVKDSVVKGEFAPVMQVKESLKDIENWNNKLWYVFNMYDIYLAERLEPTERGSFFFDSSSWEELKNKYDILKFVIRHMEDGDDSEEVQELLNLVELGEISREAVWYLAKHHALNLETVCRKIFGESLETVLSEERQKELITISEGMSQFLQIVSDLPAEQRMTTFFNNRQMIFNYLHMLEQQADYFEDVCSRTFITSMLALYEEGMSQQLVRQQWEKYDSMLDELKGLTAKMSDIKQIAFIIPTDNAQYYNECVRYIQDLEIPKGYSTDIICIQEADSIASGYCAGMKDSNAKYKVYLQQDTFILHKHFLYDIIRIFEQNKNIGMIGMMGGDVLLTEENVCSQLHVGKVLRYNGRMMLEENCEWISDQEYVSVNTVEGFLIITQYDVPWHTEAHTIEEIGRMQSMEMQKNGHCVVVPYQEKAWCYCECRTNDYSVESEKIKENLLWLVENGSYEVLDNVLSEICNLVSDDTLIWEIQNLTEIYCLEERSIDGCHSEWLYLNDWHQIHENYQWIRFVLLRTAHCRQDERIEELCESIRSGMVSKDAIRKISNVTLTSTSRVYECFLKEKREEPLVSVIVPVYNGEESVGATLESILQQTYRNIEVIVVDDASTDNSREVISEYKDARIKTMFLEKNRHVCYASNIGFEQAKGKYVALIGHDDLWKKDKIEKQIAFMEEHLSYVVCFSWVDIIDETGKNVNDTNWDVYTKFCGKNKHANLWSRKMFWEGNQFCAPSACIRKSSLDNIGYYRYGLVQLQDFDLWLRLLQEGEVYVWEEKLVQYRRFSENGRNLSSFTMEIFNRDSHEKQWIEDYYVDNLSSEEFIRIFSKDMKRPEACEYKEILCEKAFLLLKKKNCFAVKRFIELLEDEECREILEERYRFELQDFYKMNMQSMAFDLEPAVRIGELERLLSNCKSIQL